MSRIDQLLNFLNDSPGDSFLLHALALEYIKAGDNRKAQECFEKNLTTWPQYVATYYHYGKLLERLDDPVGAASLYEKGMEVARSAGDNHAFSELRSVYEELTL